MPPDTLSYVEYDDETHMRHALALARRGLGLTWPNPSVGCVIVKDSHVIGRGRTANGGRPHAEVVALSHAGHQAHGSTAYVTLEPCAHTGETGPCAEALIKAGVARVLIGCEDPDPRVSGRGVSLLKEAGIHVETGVLEEEAQALQRGFLLRLKARRPFVTLKIATTSDGWTREADSKSRWITGKHARAHVQLVRSQHDAVLAGIGTVLADDPRLTARVPGLVHNTVRAILDSERRTPETARIFEDVPACPVWILDREEVDTRNIKAVLAVLAGRGITRLFVEGGSAVLRSFLQSGLWDQFLWYRAPHTARTHPENDSYRLDLEEITTAFGLKHIKTQQFGHDALEIYGKAG